MPTSSTPDPALIASLANAIALQEGYGASATNKPTRTNNPGDIGNTDDGSTASYATPDAGWAALDAQVTRFLTGQGSNIYNPNMTLAQIGAKYASDPKWASSVASKLGISPDTTMNQLVSGQASYNKIARPGGPSSSTGASQTQSVSTTTAAQAGPTATFYGVNDAAAVDAVPVSGSTISADQAYAALQAAYPSLINYAGLDTTPWFDDPNILQVNGATDAVEPPVTFQIFFDTNSSPVPIYIELNASLSSIERSLHHVINRQPTRTGFLVTFWGMQPDQITGSGSTGLFANQLGVTDFLSISGINSDVQNILTQSFEDEEAAIALASDQGSLRVAAKDAFVEFLALFKNNGTVWYQNPNYTGYTTQLNQSAPNLWSPVTGSTIAQNAARRNDVMTRGAVAMNYRNSTYFGYFKSLTWEMDAETPFRWNFNFVFQVERTVTNVPIPSAY